MGLSMRGCSTRLIPEPKRLFTSVSSAGPSKTTIAPSKSFSNLPPIPQKVVKTPAPRRHAPTNLRTPAPIREIMPIMPTPLPSAARTRRRSRQSLTPIGQSQGGDQFKTPAPSGKWEEEISLGSIHAGLDQLALGEVAEVEEEDAEPEYMPPPMPGEPLELSLIGCSSQNCLGNLHSMCQISKLSLAPCPKCHRCGCHTRMHRPSRTW